MEDLRFKRFSLPLERREAIIQQLACWLCPKREILFAFLYGSFLEEKHFRDIDIGIFVDEGKIPANKHLDHEFALLDELSNFVAYPLDIRVINSVPLAFRYKVSGGRLLFNRDEKRLTSFLERTWDEYLDFKPIIRKYFEELAYG